MELESLNHSRHTSMSAMSQEDMDDEIRNEDFKLQYSPILSYDLRAPECAEKFGARVKDSPGACSDGQEDLMNGRSFAQDDHARNRSEEVPSPGNSRVLEEADSVRFFQDQICSEISPQIQDVALSYSSLQASDLRAERMGARKKYSAGAFSEDKQDLITHGSNAEDDRAQNRSEYAPSTCVASITPHADQRTAVTSQETHGSDLISIVTQLQEDVNQLKAQVGILTDEVRGRVAEAENYPQMSVGARHANGMPTIQQAETRKRMGVRIISAQDQVEALPDCFVKICAGMEKMKTSVKRGGQREAVFDYVGSFEVLEDLTEIFCELIAVYVNGSRGTIGQVHALTY
jgi:hypothetical protein